MPNEVVTMYKDKTYTEALYPRTLASGVHWDETKTLPEKITEIMNELEGKLGHPKIELISANFDGTITGYGKYDLVFGGGYTSMGGGYYALIAMKGKQATSGTPYHTSSNSTTSVRIEFKTDGSIVYTHDGSGNAFVYGVVL